MIFNWKAALALIVSICGLASRPEALGLLPDTWANAITLVGLVAQAITQQVARTPQKRAED